MRKERGQSEVAGRPGELEREERDRGLTVREERVEDVLDAEVGTQIKRGVHQNEGRGRRIEYEVEIQR